MRERKREKTCSAELLKIEANFLIADLFENDQDLLSEGGEKGKIWPTRHPVLCGKEVVNAVSMFH